MAHGGRSVGAWRPHGVAWRVGGGVFVCGRVGDRRVGWGRMGGRRRARSSGDRAGCAPRAGTHVTAQPPARARPPGAHLAQKGRSSSGHSMLSTPFWPCRLENLSPMTGLRLNRMRTLARTRWRPSRPVPTSATCRGTGRGGAALASRRLRRSRGCMRHIKAQSRARLQHRCSARRTGSMGGGCYPPASLPPPPRPPGPRAPPPRPSGWTA